MVVRENHPKNVRTTLAFGKYVPSGIKRSRPIIFIELPYPSSHKKLVLHGPQQKRFHHFLLAARCFPVVVFICFSPPLAHCITVTLHHVLDFCLI